MYIYKNSKYLIKISINVRPHAIKILKELSEIFELAVFTASH